MEHNLEFEIKPETIRFAVTRFWKYHYVKKREIIFTGVFLILLSLFCILKGGSVLLVIVACFIATVWLLKIRIYFLLLRKKLAQGLGGHARLSLDDSRMAIACGRCSSEVTWEEMKGSLRFPGVLLVLFGLVDFIIIPMEYATPDVVRFITGKCPEIASAPKQTFVTGERQNNGAALKVTFLWILLIAFVTVSMLLGFLVWLISVGHLDIHPKL